MACLQAHHGTAHRPRAARACRCRDGLGALRGRRDAGQGAGPSPAAVRGALGAMLVPRPAMPGEDLRRAALRGGHSPSGAQAQLWRVGVDASARPAARREVAARLASNGWTLLNVLSTFEEGAGRC